MRGCSLVGIYRCASPPIGKIRVNAPLWSKVNMHFRSAMVSGTWVHARPFAWAFNGYLKIGGCISLPWLFTWLTVCSLHGWSFLKYFVSTSCCLSVSSIMSTSNSSSMLVLSVISVLSIESASGVCCLITARWNSSKSNWISCNQHLANMLGTSADVSNHSKTSPSVHMVKQLSPERCWSNNTAHTTARNSSWVAASFC